MSKFLQNFFLIFVEKIFSKKSFPPPQKPRRKFYDLQIEIALKKILGELRVKEVFTNLSHVMEPHRKSFTAIQISSTSTKYVSWPFSPLCTFCKGKSDQWTPTRKIVRGLRFRPNKSLEALKNHAVAFYVFPWS